MNVVPKQKLAKIAMDGF